MAKLSKTGTTILWRMEHKSRTDDGLERFERVAMRSELSKLIVELHSGRHDYGWKVATRKPYPDVKERLKNKGYLEMAA